MPNLSFCALRELFAGLQLPHKDQNHISHCCQARNQGVCAINITLRCPYWRSEVLHNCIVVS